MKNAPADRLQGVTVHTVSVTAGTQLTAPRPALGCATPFTAQPRLSEKHPFAVTIQMAQKFRYHEGRTASERLAPASTAGARSLIDG